MAKPIEPNAETLAGVEIFRGLDHAARAALARRCQGRVYAPHQGIIHHQDSSRDVHFVISGRVRATIYSRSGKEVSFRDMGSGRVFGDLSAIDGEPRSANVVALDETVVLSMGAEAFWEVLHEHPGVVAAVMRELTSLIRGLSERVVEFSTLGVKNRIHAELLRLARDSAAQGNSAVISPAPTHAEIASRVSSHREAVTRELSQLHGAGLVSKEGRALRVHDIERLAAMVRDVVGG